MTLTFYFQLYFSVEVFPWPAHSTPVLSCIVELKVGDDDWKCVGPGVITDKVSAHLIPIKPTDCALNENISIATASSTQVVLVVVRAIALLVGTGDCNFSALVSAHMNGLCCT